VYENFILYIKINKIKDIEYIVSDDCGYRSYVKNAYIHKREVAGKGRSAA